MAYETSVRRSPDGTCPCRGCAADELSLEVPGAAPAPAAPALGTFARVTYEIDRVLATEAPLWAPGGSLLAGGVYRLRIEHPAAGGANRFRRASFVGFNKCNLFALDIAWRSGFRVPILNIGDRDRPRFSYPLANMMASRADRAWRASETLLRGANDIPWAWMGTAIPARAINESIAADQKVWMLVGWRASGIGHVGLVRHIESKRVDTGPLRDIVYDGWEATSRSAQSLVGRQWGSDACTHGTTAGAVAAAPGPVMRRFCALHIIGLIPEANPADRGTLIGATNPRVL